MDHLQSLLETCTALTRRVKNLEQDKIAQALEIIQLKKRVRKLEKKKPRVSGLKRLQKVRTAQRIKSSADTVMDDQEDASKQGGGIIAKINADEDVILEEVNAKEDAKVVEKNADVQGRPEESQAKVYHIDLKLADKVLSMHDDMEEPDELQEVIGVVTTAKLMTKMVTGATTRRKMVEEISKQVKEKGKQDNAVLRYQALKRKPQTEAQARKNMMVYLKNMAGFKMDYFKGMSYDNIRPIFKKYFNFNVAFLEKSKEQLEEEESKALKRQSENLEEKAAKKQKPDEEVEELKKHLQIMPNDDDDDVYIEATPLALKVPVVDYEIYTENNKPYYKIIRANGSH
uniref:Uncharacterized protein n=1 Tax=Tanacetum cinerariifolium TaxID=118510 RepID=A0A6L2L4E6_TANCI|nr:hypothetical protein [Tanacetum cinerariifolium]